MKTQVGSINRPVPFAGTPSESAHNWHTHQFDGYGDSRCLACDCKAWHETANYPCGADVPRETVITWSDGSVTTEPDYGFPPPLVD